MLTIIQFCRAHLNFRWTFTYYTHSTPTYRAATDQAVILVGCSTKWFTVFEDKKSSLLSPLKEKRNRYYIGGWSRLKTYTKSNMFNQFRTLVILWLLEVIFNPLTTKNSRLLLYDTFRHIRTTPFNSYKICKCHHHLNTNILSYNTCGTKHHNNNNCV